MVREFIFITKAIIDTRNRAGNFLRSQRTSSHEHGGKAVMGKLETRTGKVGAKRANQKWQSRKRK